MGGTAVMDMLAKGEVHLGQNLMRAGGTNDTRFAHQSLASVEMLAARHPSVELGRRDRVELDELSRHPLLLLDRAFIFRRTFDAACRLAGIAPDIRFESRGPHTLLAMAESANGVAVVPSALPTRRYAVRAAQIAWQGRPLSEPLAIFWDKRRPLPGYAMTFCEMLAEYTGKAMRGRK